MDCLIKTVKSEGYFGMYRGKTSHIVHTILTFFRMYLNSLLEENIKDFISTFLKSVIYFGLNQPI